MLIGFGLFNLVEGAINHQILGLHHVNEKAPREHWIYWDLAFLIWGAVMMAIGWAMLRRERRQQGASRGRLEQPLRPG